MKKFLKFILIIVIVVLAASAAGFALKPEIRFYAEEIIEIFKPAEKLNEISPDGFTELSFDDLKYGRNCTFDQSMILVSKSAPLPADFEAQLTQYENTEAYINTCAAKSFIEMREHIQEKFGKRLMIMSAYRSSGEQLELYNNDEDGVAAKPGESEHETGLGIDVYVKYFSGSSFVKSEIGRYVNENCGDYGFIIRYPLCQKKVTGFSYEPWHIRYVGLPHSKIIQENSLTFEEYLKNLKIDKFYEYEDYIISKQDCSSVLIPEEYESVTISPDNEGNYIITVKKV